MAGERSVAGVLAGSGAGAPGLLGLLLAMEAGVPIPVPSDLVMLLLGERVSAGALPLWLAALALELVALAGTAALFVAARGPGRAPPAQPAWPSAWSAVGEPSSRQKLERPAVVLAGRSLSGGRRYTSRLASLGVLERSRPDLLGQSRPLCPGDCWTCSTAGEPPLESGDLPELLNALVANSTTASPASTVATRMARQGRHPVRAVVTGSSGKRASFSRRP